MARFPSNPKWDNIYSDELVNVYQNENDDIHMKVIINADKTGFLRNTKRTKQFYNETVYHDVPRWVADETGDMVYWNLFS